MFIIVTSQEQLDKIPLDTDEHIIIKFGTLYNRAVLKNKYRHRVVVWGNSCVEAWGDSSVVAWGISSVVAQGDSSVVAWGDSSVVAKENSSVEAWENSNIVASGNSQIVDRTRSHNIKTSANSRIVYMPKSIHEFMDFYGIKHTKQKAILYKAVHKVDGKYLSDYDSDFEYVIGEIKKSDCINTNVKEACGSGIHISHLNWVLDYGCSWNDLAILEVEVAIDEIIMPVDTNGKVRVQKVKVLREVPLNECGLYGKILEKQRRE